MPARTPAQPAALLEVCCGDARVAVAVSFDRFRSLRLTVRPDGSVRLRAPLRTPRAQLEAFLESRTAWICRHLERLRDRVQPAPRSYADGETHHFLGQPLTLRIRQGRPAGVRLSGSTLEVATAYAPTQQAVQRLVDAWQGAQAHEIFSQALRRLLPRCEALGLPRPAQLKVRAMRSRWGTCSRTGVITLNRHLVRAPLACIEYVAAHELCHLRHMGHDARFYALLSALLPDWKPRRKRLRDVAI